MEDRVRIQIALNPESLAMLDEMCRSNGVNRASMCALAIRRYYLTDEVTTKFRDRRKTPKTAAR